MLSYIIVGSFFERTTYVVTFKNGKRFEVFNIISTSNYKSLQMENIIDHKVIYGIVDMK